MKNIISLLSILFLLTACAETQFGANVVKQATGGGKSTGAYKVGKPYVINGQEYHPQESFNYVETGIASWYGPGFHGKKTANGEVFDQNELTAAHKTLQLPSLVRVTNLDNGRAVVCRVNDRGPYAHNRIIDLSSKAADLLGFKGQGTAKVRVEVLPAESRHAAETAKAGKSTKGFEVALNGNKQPVNPSTPVTLYPDQTAVSVDTTSPADTAQAASIGSVERVEIEPYRQTPVQGHISNDGRFLPDPKVTQRTVGTSNIFIQAGAFSDMTKAQSFSQSLSSFGQTKITTVNNGGQNFYRVRLGPYSSVDQADATIGQMASRGLPKAVIVVE